MKDINIEGVVHLSSKERWGCLIGGIIFPACGISFACIIFDLIPVGIFIPHLAVLVFAFCSVIGGIALILLAVKPAKEYWIQDLAHLIFG